MRAAIRLMEKITELITIENSRLLDPICVPSEATLSPWAAMLLSGEREVEESISAAADDIRRLVQPAFNFMTDELKSLKERKGAMALYHEQIVSNSECGLEHSKPISMNSSILKLNVGGKDIDVRKSSIMPRTTSDSLFGILASGRWDNHLTKDQRGRVFLDIDPERIEY